MGIEFLLYVTVFAGCTSPCDPTAGMIDRAQAAGYEISDLGELEADNAWSCGDLNGDERIDLCARLVNPNGEWAIGCFVSRGNIYKLEEIGGSEDPSFRNTTPAALFIGVVKKGTTFPWASGAAKVSLLRDCVSVGTPESAASLFCYNGAHFLELQEGD